MQQQAVAAHHAALHQGACIMCSNRERLLTIGMPLKACRHGIPKKDMQQLAVGDGCCQPCSVSNTCTACTLPRWLCFDVSDGVIVGELESPMLPTDITDISAFDGA